MKRVVAAYRMLRTDLAPGLDDITLLGHLGDELETEAADQAAAS